MEDCPRRCPAAIAAVVLLCVVAGCAAPDTFLRRVDEERRSIGRGLIDIIDAADRGFGEARVEDAERIVQVKVGSEATARENEGVDFRVPVRIRAPLPALERWANVFFQLESVADSFDTLGGVKEGLSDNRSFTLAWITKIGEKIDTGVKNNIFWHGGLEYRVRPFARFEHRADGWRAGGEQSVYLDTGHGLGGISLVQYDRRLGTGAFGRGSLRAEYRWDLDGINYEATLLYRRAFVGRSFLSGEIGAAWNPHRGPTEEGGTPDPTVPLGEQDSDEARLRLAMTGNLWRPWLEYELGPGLHFPWYHDDSMEFSFRVMLRLVYEDYLRKR